MVLSVAMPEPRHALFPARVTLPDGTVHNPCRVATDTAGTTFAWAWDHDAGHAIEVGHWPADELERTDGRDRGRPTTLVAVDGTVITKAGGCGCGHPLKSWRPQLVANQG